MRRSFFAIGSALVFLATGCAGTPAFTPSSISPSADFQSFHVQSGKQLGCLSLNDKYCNSLHDPTSQGNLEVVRPKGVIRILQGETRNDFSQVFYQYSKAKIRRREALPRTLRGILDDRGYFVKLNALLNRSPRTQMSVFERIQYDRMAAEVSQIWTTALDETVLRRMVQKFPGYQRIRSREMPPEYEIEATKERRKLLNQVSLALWREDKNWSEVEATFQALQKSYLNVIARLNIDEETRADFSQRIRDVKLVLPGSTPEISDYECSSTTINAYYYRYLNVITVCAGDFNSEDILQTLAHEMAHALDITRSMYLFKMQSQLVKHQQRFRHQICTEKKVDCADWKAFKENIPKYLNEFDKFKPDLKSFNQCLKRRATTKTASSSDYQRIAQSTAVSSFSSLAGADYFLRIIKDKLPLKNGRMVKNPYYLNPCAYYLWTKEEEPPEDEINSLVYFTAEYSCGEASASERFRSSLETSKKFAEMVITKSLALAGEFSSHDRLMNEGFSSSPAERFADVMGSYAMADYLNQTPSIEDRRGKYLASISWLCEEPSLRTQFPEESSVENDFNEEVHTDGLFRIQEILSAPIRSSLQCQKDFQFKECSLDFKSN